MISIRIHVASLALLWCISNAVTGCVFAQQTRNSGSTEKGSIVGKVQTEAGEPVPNAKITISPMAVGTNATVTLISDSEGRFVARGLLNFAYRVFVSASGYLPVLASTGNEDREYLVPPDKVTITLVKGGVVTGRVTNTDSHPIVGAKVLARLVRAGGRKDIRNANIFGEARTDDRGIYRIFGLRDGAYKVYTSGVELLFSMQREVVSYYPSASESTASLVEVELGSNSSGIDIVHRGEVGRSVSGVVLDPDGIIHTTQDAWIISELLLRGRNVDVGAESQSQKDSREFHFIAVPDGEYSARAFVIGRSGSALQAVAATDLANVTVRGADVTGVKLRLTSLGMVGGKLSLEEMPKISCSPSVADITGKTVLSAFQKTTPLDEVRRDEFKFSPDSNGDFRFYELMNGRYFMKLQLPDKTVFVKSVKQMTGGKQVATGLQFQNKPGINLQLLTTISTGGASISGGIGDKSKGKVIYLVPEESGQEEVSIRYYQAIPEAGKFEINHISPGNYLLLASSAFNPDVVLDDADGRSKVMSEARKNGISFTLKPCQRVAGVKLE